MGGWASGIADVIKLKLFFVTCSDAPSQQCCYNDDGVLVTGDLAGGHVQQSSPLIDFNAHNMNDLLPFAFCCRGSMPENSRCNLYDEYRPSFLTSAEAYELPLSGIYMVRASPDLISNRLILIKCDYNQAFFQIFS